MNPPDGALGPAFAATHSSAAESGDSSPVSRIARTTKYVFRFLSIRESGSKSSAGSDIPEESSLNELTVSVEVSLQYTVYRTVRPGASGVPFVKVVTGVQVRRHVVVVPDTIGPVIPRFFTAAGTAPGTSTIVTLIVPVRPP